MIKEDFEKRLTQEDICHAKSIIDEAHAYNVNIIINVGTSLIESENSIALANAYSCVYASVGIHPTDGTNNWKEQMSTLEKNLINDYHHKIVGVGECGIDLYHKPYQLSLQEDLFKAQIELALRYDRALIIHSRDASHETMMILDQYLKDIKRATMHCFSYDLSLATELVQKGFMLGIDAPVTYPKNSVLRTVVQQIPLTAIVLETDAPFLPPQEERGKKNHPRTIKRIAEEIARLRHESVETVARQTTLNAKKLFAL